MVAKYVIIVVSFISYLVIPINLYPGTVEKRIANSDGRTDGLTD